MAIRGHKGFFERDARWSDPTIHIIGLQDLFILDQIGSNSFKLDQVGRMDQIGSNGFSLDQIWFV